MGGGGINSTVKEQELRNPTDRNFKSKEMIILTVPW